MRKLRFGIVGAGDISRLHVSALGRLSDQAEIVAICDPRKDHRAKLAGELGVPGFVSLEETIREARPDVVNILTPPMLHAAQAEIAMEAGCHTIIEKPADVNLEAVDRIIEASRRTGKLATVISQRRFDPAATVVKQAAEEGRFGRITRAAGWLRWWRGQEYFDEAPWRGEMASTGGGALMAQAIHVLDLMLWIAGPASEVFAYRATLAHEGIDVEDCLSGVLRFESGALGSLEATIAAYPGISSRLEISGDHGSAVIENEHLAFFHAARPGEIRNARSNTSSENRASEELAAYGPAPQESDPIAKKSRPHEAQIADFISAIRKGHGPAVRLMESRTVIETIGAFYESSRTGRAVALSDRV